MWLATVWAGAERLLGHSLFRRKPALSLNFLDLLTKPARERLFHLRLASSAVKVIHGLAVLTQLDEAARDCLGLPVRRNKLLEQAVLTWKWTR